SLVVDEGGHLLSGLMALERGSFNIYRVNPPLVKALAAIPVALSQPQLPEHEPCESGWVRQHDEFMHANGDRYHELLCRSRYVIVALAFVGGWLIYRWSSSLFGPMSGIIAAALWALCPNVLGWSGVVTADMGAAVFGLAAMYALRLYVHNPGWRN